MVLLDEIILENLPEHELSLAKKYLQEGDLMSLRIHALPSGDFQVDGLIKVHSHINRCTIFVDTKNNQFYQGSCDCPWFFDDENPCAHVLVLVLYLTKVDISSFPYHFERKDNTSYRNRMMEYRNNYRERMEMYGLQSSFQKTIRMIHRQKEAQDLFIRQKLETERVDLIPHVYMYDDLLTVEFSIIGLSGKKYIIKNIHELLYHVDLHLYHSYGKHLAFVHDLHTFTPQAQKYLNFIRIVSSKQGDEDQFATRVNTRRELILSNLMLLFYETFKEDPHVPFKEGSFHLTLQIRKKDGYYHIESSQLQDHLYLIDQNHIFELDQDTGKIIHYPCKKLSSLPQLVKTMQENHGIDLPFKFYEDFEKYMLDPCRDEIKIESGIEYLPESTKMHVSQPIVYGDLSEDDTLFFHATGTNADGESVELLYNPDISTNITIDLIEKSLEEYASSVQKESHTVYMDLDDERTFDFLQKGLDQLTKYCDVFVSDPLKHLGKKKKYNLQTGLRIQNGLLEMHLESSDFDVHEIPAILQALHKKKRYFKLKSGDLLHLESEEFKELDALLQDFHLDEKDIHDGMMKMDIYRTLGMEARLKGSKHLQLFQDESLIKYIKNFNDKNTKISINPYYDPVLRDYQKIGVEWLLTLYQYHLNGILADEMGLGKTLQVIALLDTIRSKDHHSLVVCPASLIYNWEDEIHRFSSSLTCVSITGTKEERLERLKQFPKQDVLITSYDYLRRDIEYYESLSFTYVILDEAQNIKNPKTQNAHSVKKLHAKHRLALSGTPIENSLSELWSIFDFLMPGYLFSYPYFRSHYESPIALSQDQEVTKNLQTMVSPFILRRTKKEVLFELPDKVDHQYLINFSKQEQKIYLANLSQANQKLQKALKEPSYDRIAVLAMLTRLRQICCDPRLVYDNLHGPSSKMQACIDLVQVVVKNHKKVLIFSAFTSLLDLLGKELDKNQIPYLVLIGSTSKEERRKRVQTFQKEDVPVFLISLKAGGTGLNLTAAEVVIHIDPWWNISAQNQATDRAHRIGQNANVQVYRLIMKDSIEEKIVHMQEQKKDLADTFIEGNDGSLGKMSKDEILELFNH